MALSPFSGSKRSRDRWWWLAGRFGLVTLAILTLGLLILSHVAPLTAARWRGTALDAAAPAMAVLALPMQGVRAVGSYIGSYLNARGRAEHLEAEVLQLRTLAERNQRLEYDNQRLAKLLALADPKPQLVRAVRVVGATSGSTLQSVLITAGRHESIAMGQPLRDPDGLIGQITEVGQHSARVMLLTDANSRIPVRVIRTGMPAIVAGANSNRLHLLYVDPDHPVKMGDRLVTSGQGGIFPPGIPVAQVVHAGPEPRALPIANLLGLDYALVLQPYSPPPPDPAPSPPQEAPGP